MVVEILEDAFYCCSVGDFCKVVKEVTWNNQDSFVIEHENGWMLNKGHSYVEQYNLYDLDMSKRYQFVMKLHTNPLPQLDTKLGKLW